MDKPGSAPPKDFVYLKDPLAEAAADQSAMLAVIFEKMDTILDRAAHGRRQIAAPQIA